tara:strand:+ start:334 stop:1173 length:840 start_codon:yes stop_codon:yes gene_type:complete
MELYIMSTKKSNKKLSDKETKDIKKQVPSNKSSFTKNELVENVKNAYTLNSKVDNAVLFFNENNSKFNLGKDKHWTSVKPNKIPSDVLDLMKSNFVIHWYSKTSPLLVGWKKVDGEKIIRGIENGGSSFNIVPSMLLDMPKKTEFVKSYGDIAWSYIYAVYNNYRKAFSKSVISLQEKGASLIQHQEYLDAVEKSGGDISLVDVEKPKASTGRDRTIWEMLQWEVTGNADEHSKVDNHGNHITNEKSLTAKVNNSKDTKAQKEWLKVLDAFDTFLKSNK